MTEEQTAYKKFLNKKVFLIKNRSDGQTSFHKGELTDVTKDHVIIQDMRDGPIMILISSIVEIRFQEGVEDGRN